MSDGWQHTEEKPWRIIEPEVVEFVPPEYTKSIRVFDSGATRDTNDGKLDYEAFFSPAVLKRRAEYMHKHKTQSNGELRSGDNWQRGFPIDECMKSGWRHFVDWWTKHRLEETGETIEDSICAVMFNCEAYLDSLLKNHG